MSRSHLAVAALLCASCASAPVRERCRFVTEHVPRPNMPAGFRELDSMFLHRAWDMTLVARGLNGRWSERYRHTFAEQLLPAICERVERARAEAAAGDIRKAGAHYQGLLVASQVLGLHLAYVQMSDAADQAGHPSPVVYEILEQVEEEMRPYWTAALLEDSAELLRVMPELPARYNAWLAYLNGWMAQVEIGERRVAIARVLWDTFMATVAAYELAAAMAGSVAGGLPPAIASIAGRGGAAVAVPANAAALEALRKLIAIGALDASVVAAISRMAGGAGGPGGLTITRPLPMQSTSPPGGSNPPTAKKPPPLAARARACRLPAARHITSLPRK